MKDTAEAPRRIVCTTCARYITERVMIGRQWDDSRRCSQGIRFAGERVECVDYLREPGSDDE